MKLSFLALFIFTAFPTQIKAESITYQGSEGFGTGKHIVFLASDHEYRSEETCPALARIFAKHYGFKCTVVFGTDEEGFIEAGSSQITGIEALLDADLFFIFARFLNPPDDQMAKIDNYLTRGGPVVGLRTSSHAFKMPASAKYSKYDFKSRVKGFEDGFGHQVLGNTWISHYGANHRQGSRIQIVPEQRDHVILSGVGDNAFTHAGGYMAKPGDDFTVLANTQPLVSMDPDADPDMEKPPVASAWTRHYEDVDGESHRVFHSTQGASEDILDENFRRLVINGTLWALGMEDSIDLDLNIDFVGPYQPNTFSFDGAVQNVKPSDLEGWDTPIMPAEKTN